MNDLLLVAMLLELFGPPYDLMSQSQSIAERSETDALPFGAIHLPVGTHPTMVPIADANNDRTLTVYMCKQGNIIPAAYSPIHVAHAPHGVAIADFNHDRKGDIVVAEEEVNDVLVLLSK